MAYAARGRDGERRRVDGMAAKVDEARRGCSPSVDPIMIRSHRPFFDGESEKRQKFDCKLCSD